MFPCIGSKFALNISITELFGLISLWKTVTWGSMLFMENLVYAEIIEEVKKNTYDNELADIYIRELLDQNKEYE